MLLCCATLESMVKGIVKHTQTGHYREAVCLLEYIHSRFPSVGMEEQYVNLLVDIKTKVALGASAVVVSTASPSVILTVPSLPSLPPHFQIGRAHV